MIAKSKTIITKFTLSISSSQLQEISPPVRHVIASGEFSSPHVELVVDKAFQQTTDHGRKPQPAAVHMKTV